MPKRIPVSAAKKLAQEQRCRQVIVLAWDGALTHVVTYGETSEDCDQAAQGGDLIKQAMGWPEHKLFPSRVQALTSRAEAAENERDQALAALAALQARCDAAQLGSGVA